MQIVSKWRGESVFPTAAHRFVKRVQPAQRMSGTKGRAPFVADRAAGGHAHPEGPCLIATQLIASHFAGNFDLSFDHANQLNGRAAYDDALQRKIHRLEKGLFYHDYA